MAQVEDQSPNLEDADDLVSPATASSRIPLPSSRAATNLLIADVIVRGASNLISRNLDERIAKASANNAQEAKDALDGRTLITTLGLYAANRLATRSVPGLAIVVGGLVLKALYDRGKDRQRRLTQISAKLHDTAES